MQRILITGGSGFIGTNLVDYYLSKGFKVLNIDIKPPQENRHLSLWKKVDICNEPDLRAVFLDFSPHYVLHMAARADLRGTTLDDYETNIKGLENVLNVCHDTESVKKVIMASSMLVCRAGYIPQHDQDYCPPNLYGESKALGEKIVHNRAKQLRCAWVIVRPSSIWGPWFGPTYRQFFEMILKRRYVNFSGKMCVKTYGFIGNVVYQIDSLLFSKEADGKVFYLGDYNPTEIKEWATEIADSLQVRILTVPKIIISVLAKCGDLLQRFGFRFPMNSFRLKNMTTDNVLPLDNTRSIAPLTLFTREQGNRMTIDWLQKHYFPNKK